jgi:hypothetical protein
MNGSARIGLLLAAPESMSKPIWLTGMLSDEMNGENGGGGGSERPSSSTTGLMGCGCLYR